jgi:hypothetical protein
MPRRCTVCAHPDRPSLEQAMVNRRPFRNIAQQAGLTVWSLLRHHDEHLGELLAKAEQAKALEADALLERLRRLLDLAEAILARAEREGDHKTALSGIGQARGCLELLLEVEGRVDRRPTVNLLILPEWLAVRTALLEALHPYPEARAAVAERLAAFNGATTA